MHNQFNKLTKHFQSITVRSMYVGPALTAMLLRCKETNGKWLSDPKLERDPDPVRIEILDHILARFLASANEKIVAGCKS